MVAAGVRNIKLGTEYDKFFGKPERLDPYWPKGSVYNTLEFMERIVANTTYQTKAISKVLAGRTLDETCKNIWSFLYNHIQYKEDRKNVEQLRNPYRAWADRKTGIDCDCFSIFISSILTNLRIPHALRITEYDSRGYFQHVYVVVPIGPIDYPHGTFQDRKTYLAIDPVLDQYNYEKPFSKKHDKVMIVHQYLNGVGSVVFGAEFDQIQGLGNATNADVNEAMRLHLQNTLQLLKENPRAVVDVVDPYVFKAQVEYLLDNWRNPVARAAALEELAEMEDRGENTPKGTVSGLGCACRTGIAPKMPKEVAMQKIAVLAERRKANPIIIPATYRRGTTVNNPKLHSLCHAYACSPSMNGLNGKFFEKIKTAIQNTTQKVQTAVQNTKDKVQEVTQKVGEKVKTAAKAVVQQNPVTVSIRGGVLLAMKTNAFKMADRIKWGYLTESEAVKRGFDVAEWRKVKLALDQTISTFQKLGGKPENLKQAILTGKSGGLGVAAAAGLMAAASAVIAKIGGWLKNIDNSKLLQKVKGGINKARELVQSKLPSDSTQVASMVAADTTITDEFTSEIQTRAAEVDTATAFTEPNTSNSNDKTFMQKNGVFVIGGILLAGGIGYAMYNASQNKKSLKGLIPDENLKTKQVSI
jgi:hypothetical protein